MKVGILNHTGIELLRMFETRGVKNSSTMLPHRSSLQKHAKKVESIVQESCPIVEHEEFRELGEEFKFDFEKTTRLLLTNHYLLHADSDRQV